MQSLFFNAEQYITETILSKLLLHMLAKYEHNQAYLKAKTTHLIN